MLTGKTNPLPLDTKHVTATAISWCTQTLDYTHSRPMSFITHAAMLFLKVS